MKKAQIYEIFYKEKDYSKIKKMLEKSSDSWSFNVSAKIKLAENKPMEAFQLFDKANNLYGCAYCSFLNGDLKEAKVLLKLAESSYSFVNWLLFLINLVEGDLGYTTYFQVRNFYEQDLEMLIQNHQFQIAENIISHTDYIADFNREVYKYCARVLFNNEYIKEAEIMLNNSLNICYNDPETHYIMGEINLIKNNIKGALYQFETAVRVNNGYYPAEIQVNRLKNRKILCCDEN